MKATYPESPGFKAVDTETSRQAAAAVAGRAKTLRERVEEVLAEEARTADEVARELGESELAVRPRLSELKAKGLIEATEERRRNGSGKMAVVWRGVKSPASVPEFRTQAAFDL